MKLPGGCCMDPFELLESIAKKLDQLGIPYLVTGSVAAMAYGEPRFTNDIDIVAGIKNEHIEGLLASFASPEDIILMKMRYFQEGGSEKHLRDIAGILIVSGSEIDIAYLEKWIEEFGLQDIWKLISDKMGKS
jgi:hypothetical protein